MSLETKEEMMSMELDNDFSEFDEEDEFDNYDNMYEFDYEDDFSEFDDEDEQDVLQQTLSAVSLNNLTKGRELDELVLISINYANNSNMDFNNLRHQLLEVNLRSVVEDKGYVYDDILISSSEADVGYNDFIITCYPALSKLLGRVLNSENRGILISCLKDAVMLLVEENNNYEDTDKSGNDHLDDIGLEAEIEANTQKVMRVYKDLFEVGFELQLPYGVMTKDGVLRIDNGYSKQDNMKSLRVLYDIINEASQNLIVQQVVKENQPVSTLREIDIRKSTTYYPNFQLGNLFGVLRDKKVDSWRDLSKEIEPEIKRNIRKNLKAGRDISKIVDGLTTCIVVSEFNIKSAVRLRVNVGNCKFNETVFRRLYEANKSHIYAGIGELYHTDTLNSGVVEIIIVFNKAAFNGKPLFAYEAVQNLKQRGRKPSINRMILGQDTSGRILTTNLDTQQACIVLIGAGQRSGKGVLTLNILGTVLADGCPLIYLDGKPDMATVLWNVGRKYNIKPAVWDAFHSNGNTVGVGAPDRILSENPSIFGVLMYFKVVQLMMLSASLQVTGHKFLDGKRPFFVFDEALAVQMTQNSSWKMLLDTAKNKNADPQEKEWCEKVVTWVESIGSGLPAVINSQLPKSGISTIWLFQSMQPTSWNQYATQGLTSTSKFNIMKSPIDSRLSLKILGRGTSDSEYGLSKLREDRIIATRVLSDGGRHFAMTGSQKITDINAVKVFKPYLVLNESETGTQSAEEFKKNIPEDVLRVLAPNGDLPEGAGFEGFARMIGEEAILNLTKGRLYLEEVMRTVGLMDKYSSVDEYLYDASIESFLTLGALTRGAEENKVDVDYIPYDLGREETNTGVFKEQFDNMPNEESNISGDFNPFGEDTQSKGFNPFEELSSLTGEGELDKGDTIDLFSNEETPVTLKGEQQDVSSPQGVFGTPLISSPSGYISPNNQTHYDGVYESEVKVVDNPFVIHSRADKSAFSAINAVRRMSDILLQEMTKVVGSYDRVYTFEATTSGIVINNIVFQPKFSQDVIDSLPYDIRNQVLRGNVIELFHFENIYKFRNLEVLRVDNARLAEGRMRTELGLSPRRSWYALFRKMKRLQEMYIGGYKINNDETARTYDNNGRGGFDLTEKLRNAFKLDNRLISNSFMENVWRSRPVKIFGGALGATVGVKAVTLAATVFGAWGLLFGAFAGYGVYNEMKNRRNR